MKTIITKRLILRPYTVQDFTVLHEILSDRETMRFWPEPFTAEKTANRIKRSMLSYETNGFGKFAVELKESRKLIGDCGITLVEIEGKIENNLGYVLHRTFHGNGFATEAAAACVNFALGELRLGRLIASMEVNNKASVRVAEKIGMIKEKEYYNKKNRGLLTYLYSIAKTG